MEEIEVLVNQNMLCTEENPSKWLFLLNQTNTHVGVIHLDNNKTRLITNYLEVIIDDTCTNENRKYLWKRCLTNVRIALILLRKRNNRTHNRTQYFQSHIDLFAQYRVELWEVSGIKNHMHMLISSDSVDRMIEHNCLYRFSLQGWKKINSLIKIFFFKYTNHGHSAERGKNSCS